ncbi:hypothetical protein J6836_06745 [Providencia sp. R33]|uniref:hypothetical protein n=1 Tax=Providencia sp. R33 TaxID=2828763 RepID=UPI001C5BC242|nr:hypothetical protein [Providencia sp. R33]QXX84057.1 hypothetical protein J6836_06675 [Providencia sp. R33]QXX84071.1 hypothetical protein J6836_06745 [Providencia sp. R33]
MKTVWIDEESFLQMAKIGWIDYSNARLDNNKLLGIELPPRRKNGNNTHFKMTLTDVTRFINDYNEAKKNQHN